MPCSYCGSQPMQYCLVGSQPTLLARRCYSLFFTRPKTPKPEREHFMSGVCRFGLFCLFVPRVPFGRGRGVSVFVLSTACCMGVAMHISAPGAAVLRIVHPSLVGPADFRTLRVPRLRQQLPRAVPEAVRDPLSEPNVRTERERGDQEMRDMAVRLTPNRYSVITVPQGTQGT